MAAFEMTLPDKAYLYLTLARLKVKVMNVSIAHTL